jgi:hypothetical protein
VILVDQQTAPIAIGGICGGANGKCGNHFGFLLNTISLDWQEFTVPFSALRQENWSSEMFAAPQLTNALGLRFQVGKTAFDFSVDDVELYR